MNRTEKSIQKFKALELIQTFSTLEMKRFGRFLQSPYHNNNQDLITLFDFLRSLHPTFDQPKLNRQNIWKALFKSKPFDSIKFKKLFSELNLLAEEFIIIENIKSNKRKQQKQLIDALKPRHFKRFVKESQVLIKEIESKKEYQSQEDFLDLHLLNQDMWYHVEWERHQVNQQELMAAHEHLVTYLEFNKVKTVSEIESRKKFLNLSDFEYPKTLKNILNNKLVQTNKSLALNYQFYNFEKKPSWETYLSLKELIFSHHLSFDKKLIQSGIAHLNNYLANEIGRGELGLNEELFDLLKWVAENKILIINGSIDDILFRNTFIIAIKNQQIDWARNYIKTSKKYLRTLNKQFIISYLNATIAFVTKDFKSVLNALSCLQPSNNNQYYFHFKTLITRSYLELIFEGFHGYELSLYSELEAFEKGLKRNRKSSENRKNSYRNYVKIFKRLIKLLSPLEEKEELIDNLKNTIENTSPLALKSWLLDKIEFLQKSNRN